jgi:hypothetical protein
VRFDVITTTGGSLARIVPRSGMDRLKSDRNSRAEKPQIHGLTDQSHQSAIAFRGAVAVPAATGGAMRKVITIQIDVGLARLPNSQHLSRKIPFIHGSGGIYAFIGLQPHKLSRQDG